MLEQIAASHLVAERLLRYLPLGLSDIANQIELPQCVNTFAFSFQVKIPHGKAGFAGISLSTPPDTMGSIQLGLLGEDLKLVFLDSLGYGDIREFGSRRELVSEIRRLVALAMA